MGDDSISSLLLGKDLAKISAGVLGDDSVMDDIPFFSPAGAQAWWSYHYSKSQMLVSLLSDKDLAKIFAAVLGDDSAMDNIPCFSPAGEQAWQASFYIKHVDRHWQF